MKLTEPLVPNEAVFLVLIQVDIPTRLAYTELLDDERKETAAAFWHRANAWFAKC